MHDLISPGDCEVFFAETGPIDFGADSEDSQAWIKQVKPGHKQPNFLNCSGLLVKSIDKRKLVDSETPRRQSRWLGGRRELYFASRPQILRRR